MKDRAICHRNTRLDQALSIMRIIEEFEDDDDVQSVSHNLEVSDELSEALA